MDRVYLAWTMENWITVLLMVAFGYLVFALMAQVLRNFGRG